MAQKIVHALTQYVQIEEGFPFRLKCPMKTCNCGPICPSDVNILQINYWWVTKQCFRQKLE